MVADARFAHEFEEAMEIVCLQDEAELFARVLRIARERHDEALITLAAGYHELAARKAERAERRGGTRLPASLLELARVAARHPSHHGVTRSPLAAV